MYITLQFVKAFFWLSGAALIVALIWSGFAVADINDECANRGGILVKTNVDGYVCIDKGVLK